MTGLALKLGNSKVIAFFLALLPSVVALESLGPLAFAELAAVIAAIASGVLAAYVFLAARMRRRMAASSSARSSYRSGSDGRRLGIYWRGGEVRVVVPATPSPRST